MTGGEVEPQLDLDAYLARIGYTGSREPKPDTLAALHLAHAQSIPFENLDVLLGRGIRLDLASLEQKLVRDRRGGYCFEQNLLFAAVLEALGFRVARLAARVRLGATRVLPRTHMCVAVDVDGTLYLADVGFGAEGLYLPIPLAADQPHRQLNSTYQLRAETADHWVLESKRATGWFELYVFTLEPQHLSDYEVANWYVSTNPQSPFTRTLTAQRLTPEARHILRGRELITERDGQQQLETLADDAAVLEVLAERFGLEFPRDTRFRNEPWIDSSARGSPPIGDP
ncbi:MAG: arylamine N-acetyltransferase [Pirellulales bacterium]